SPLPQASVGNADQHAELNHDDKDPSDFRIDIPDNATILAGNIHLKSRNLPQTPIEENKSNRAAPTPIFVIHQPYAHHQNQRKFYRRHCICGDEMPHLKYENEKDEDSDEIDEESQDAIEDWNEEDEEGVKVEEEKNVDDRDADNGATLDLRGLFVREAIAAVQTFLPAQDQRYIFSGFKEISRFVYIITGWGKMSPNNVPKVKPAVENLLNSSFYKLKYQYV
ncbi:hypothetical protein EGW08_023760, partial [Elysia chlorotica]